MNIMLLNSFFKNGEGFSIGGVEYHRMAKPHSVIRRSGEFDFVMCNGIDERVERYLSETDLVIISRAVHFEKMSMVYDKLDSLNIPYAIDLDDYWHLPEYHILYDTYKRDKTPEATIEGIKRAKFVTCSTPILAERIKEYNPNVYVCPNGIDSDDEVWQAKKEPSERLRFGFTQGNTHFEDIQSIASDVVKALKDPLFYEKGQIIQAGFAGSHHKKTNEVKIQYLLTDNLKTLRKDYPDHVHDLRLFRESNNKNVPYRMKWGVDVYQFPNIYNEIDVSVVPLLEGEFNSCKSELKMLEAAAKDCAVMVSHVKPYTLLATDKNSFDLNKKPFHEWAKYLIENPNALEDSKGQLKEDCKKYDLKALAEQRKNIYLKYKWR